MTGDPGDAKPPALRWWLAAIVVVAAFVAFAPALSGEFVNWDDERALTRNESYRGFSSDNLAWMFSTYHMGHYQPLTWISYGLDHAIWGDDASGYHLTNLLLHALAALLFFFVARRLIAIAQGVGIGERGAWWGAGIAALLFAVHPLRVESVAWITERRDLLSGCGLLAAVLFYLRIHTAREEGRSTRILWAGLLACYIASLLSKAWGMSLPVVLLLVDWYPLRRFDRVGALLRLVREKAVLLVLAVLVAWQASQAQAGAGAAMSLADHSLLHRFAQAGYGVCFYLWKTIVPVGLSPLYPIRWGFDVFETVWVGCALGVIAGFGFAWAARRRWPGITCAWLYYLVVVAPVLGFLQSGPQLVADRYSYLACMGWVVLLGAVVARGARVASPAVRSVWIASSFVVVVALAASTYRQSRVWKDSFTLWDHALQLDPELRRGNVMMASALVETGDRANIERAVSFYQRAIELSRITEDNVTHKYLGDVFARLDRLADAVHQWEAYIESYPNDAQALSNLSLACRKLGRQGDAARYQQRAARVR